MTEPLSYINNMIADAYISKQIAKFSIIILAVATSLFFFYTLAIIANETVVGNLSPNTVFTLATLRILIALPFLMQTAYYFGIVATLTQLQQTSEILAMHCLGWSEWRLAKPTLIIGTILMLLTACTTIWLRPWAYGALYTVEKQAITGSNVNHISIGKFINLNKEWVLNIVDTDKQTGDLIDVFIHSRPKDDEDEEIVVLAQRGKLSKPTAEDSYNLRLRNGQVHQLNNESGNYRQHNFDELHFVIEERSIFRTGQRRARSTWALAQSSNHKIEAEFQWRISFPLATLLLSAIAVPVSRMRPRQASYRQWLLAIAIYTGVFYGSSVITNWVENAVINPLPGVWTLWLILALMAVIFYRRPRFAV